MKKSRLATIILLIAGLLGVTAAQADCKYDVVGTTTLKPVPSVAPDGQVTYGMANWWEDDVLACWHTHQTPALLQYFSACDFNGNGAVEFNEVVEIYHFVSQHENPDPSGPIYKYLCPVVDAEQVAYTASGVCTEMNEYWTPVFCPADQLEDIIGSMDYLLAAYPFTQAVYDGHHGVGQSWAQSPYKILCWADEPHLTAELFADHNAVYNATTQLLLGGGGAIIEYAQGVNIHKMINEYTELLQAFPGGYCEADTLIGGAPTGFHAEHAVPHGWMLHTVQATADCDFYGCRCDATLQVWSTGDDTYHEESLVNNSGVLDGTGCNDARFNF